MAEDKKNVLIVTIWDTENVGNRLQNYALQQVLISLGCSVKTAVVDQHPLSRLYKEKLLVKKILLAFGMEKYRSAIRFEQERKDREYRRVFGKAFSETFIPNTEYIGRFQDAFSKDFSAYDYAIAGSDQIWHKWYAKEEDELLYYGLTFMPSEKRIAYAGSFGFNSVPEERTAEYTGILEGYASISVREDTAADIVNQLTGREAKVVLDPSLMLNAEQWNVVENCPAFLPERPFALVYALGGKSEVFASYIDKMRDNEGYEILDVRQKDQSGKELPVGPAEFVYLIHHAEVILTDSFHATAFSLLYHKKVIVFQRNSGIDMSTRITSLSRLAGLDEQTTEKGVIFMTNENTDFSAVDERFETEREQSLLYLKNAIGGGKN